MNHIQASYASQHALNSILRKSATILRDNATIKEKFIPHTHEATNQLANNLIIQTGIKAKALQQSSIEHQHPKSIRRDTLSYRSVNKTRSKSNPKKEKEGNFVKSGNSNRSGKGGRKEERRKEENIFISLDEIEKGNGRIIIGRRKEEEERIEESMRNKKNKENKVQREERMAKEMKERQEREKQEKIERYLRSYMQRKGNQVTFDEKGKIMYINMDRQKSAIKKRYPPSGVQFSFDDVPEFDQQKTKTQHIKERAAKGQAFASAVLKTMNISRVSMMNATAQIDEYAFMKRNDLFNNNHTRQISNIPYLQMAQGTSFTEQNTNLSVSKKNSDRRTSHSQTKSKFKTHAGQLPQENSCIDIKSQMIKTEHKVGNEKAKRRAQSSYVYRPKSSRPMSHRTGRITSVNEELIASMLQ